MRKVLLIGWKDLTLAFRDRTALILMLAAPFLLTLGLGLVTGAFTAGAVGGAAASNIPIVVVDEDGGDLGAALAGFLASDDLSGLLSPTSLGDPVAARRRVDDDLVTAAVLIPAGLTESLAAPDAAGPQVIVYGNPTRPTGVGVVQAVVESFMDRVEVGRIGAGITVSRLIREGLLAPVDAATLGSEIGERLGTGAAGAALTVRGVTTAGEVQGFDPLAYMAPGMALMFLMYTVTNGGRTLLAERAQGTLPRLLVTPTHAWAVLAGKVLGVYLTGVVQLLILIGASTLLFGLRWGDALGVLALVLAAVAGAVGWGVLLTALARTPSQVSTVGSAMMLTFGILGGSFFSLASMPDWFGTLSKITPNAWGLAGFQTLALGGTMADVLLPVGALLAMGALLFALGAVIAGRKRFAQA